MADNSEQENCSPKKIQFSLPVLQPRLDPRSLEQIRRRRPTPATLVLLSDLSSPEEDYQDSMKSKPHTYPPPTYKELQNLSFRFETLNIEHSSSSSPESERSNGTPVHQFSPDEQNSLVGLKQHSAKPLVPMVTQAQQVTQQSEQPQVGAASQKSTLKSGKDP